MSWDAFDNHVLAPTRHKHEKLLNSERLNALETREKERLENILGKAEEVQKLISVMTETCQQVELFLFRVMPIIDKTIDVTKLDRDELLKVFGSIDSLNGEYNRILKQTNNG